MRLFLSGGFLLPLLRHPRFTSTSAALVLLAVSAACHLSPTHEVTTNAWLSDWDLPAGFSMRIDVEGFDFPTAIAFVPHPGPDPKSPLYFVTEIRGKVKVVTNDRSVYTFAESPFVYHPPEELPSLQGEAGMAGITLDPVHGYVFVSTAYLDAHKILRNNLLRFDSRPGVFGVKAEGMTAFTEIFKKDISILTHQIGAMILEGDTLLMGVGDGGQHLKSAALDSTLGKVLRMTLDGKPLPDNPFYESADIGNPQNFVWALGLRNPFGLCQVDGRLFASENGIGLDRFVEIRRGEDFGWDGTDWSIGMKAATVFGPTTVSPVAVTWLPQSNPLFPEQYRSSFFVALHGGQSYSAGVATLDYDFENSRLAYTPRQFLLHVREKRQKVQPVGLAFGPDALYVVPLYPVRPDKEAKGAVLRVAYEPANAHARHLDADETVEALMAQSGCFRCHGRQPLDLNVAPPLDRETLIPRILTRIGSSEYRLRVGEMDALTDKPYVTYRQARREVLRASGTDQAATWIKYHVMEPRFDQTISAMPNLDLTEPEAREIADYLVRRNIGGMGITGFLRRLAQPYRYGPVSRRHLLGAFAMGFLAASGLWAGWRLAIKLAGFVRARRAASGPTPANQP